MLSWLIFLLQNKLLKNAVLIYHNAGNETFLHVNRSLSFLISPFNCEACAQSFKHGALYTCWQNVPSPVLSVRFITQLKTKSDAAFAQLRDASSGTEHAQAGMGRRTHLIQLNAMTRQVSCLLSSSLVMKDSSRLGLPWAFCSIIAQKKEVSQPQPLTCFVYINVASLTYA